MNKILIVEDEFSISNFMKTVLEGDGYTVEVATCAAQARAALEKMEFSAMLLDLGLPDADGLELLRELRQQRSVDIVVLSSQLEDMDGYEFLKRLNSLHNRPLLLLQGDDWYSDATASFLRPDGRQYLPERSSLLDLLLDLRSSTDIGIFWVLPFCKQLYAEWGILQPDVNCEYLTTALQVVCGTERKLAVRKEILQTVAEEHHTTVAAVDCGMRRLIDGVEKYNTEAWQKFKQDYGLMGHSVTLGKLIYAGRQKLIDSGTQGRKAGR